MHSGKSSNPKQSVHTLPTLPLNFGTAKSPNITKGNPFFQHAGPNSKIGEIASLDLHKNNNSFDNLSLSSQEESFLDSPMEKAMLEEAKTSAESSFPTPHSSMPSNNCANLDSAKIYGKHQSGIKIAQKQSATRPTLTRSILNSKKGLPKAAAIKEAARPNLKYKDAAKYSPVKVCYYNPEAKFSAKAPS